MPQCPRTRMEPFAKGTKHCSDSGRLRIGDFQQTTEAPLLGQQGQQFSDCVFLAQLAELRSVSKKVEQRSFGFGEAGPCLRSSRMDDGVVSD